MPSSRARGGFRLDIRKNFFAGKRGQAWEEAVQGGGRVTKP